MDEVSVCIIEDEAFIIVSREGEAVGMCSLVDAIAEGVEHSHGVERVGWLALASDLEMLARLLRLSLAQHGIDCKSREREDEGQGSGH